MKENNQSGLRFVSQLFWEILGAVEFHSMLSQHRTTYKQLHENTHCDGYFCCSLDYVWNELKPRQLGML